MSDTSEAANDNGPPTWQQELHDQAYPNADQPEPEPEPQAAGDEDDEQ